MGVGQRSILLFLKARNDSNYGELYLNDLLTDLQDRGYCTIKQIENLYWCKITPLGRDLIDYNISCPNSIARPPQHMIPNA